jgi:hypothetical protein
MATVKAGNSEPFNLIDVALMTAKIRPKVLSMSAFQQNLKLDCLACSLSG